MGTGSSRRSTDEGDEGVGLVVAEEVRVEERPADAMIEVHISRLVPLPPPFKSRSRRSQTRRGQGGGETGTGDCLTWDARRSAGSGAGTPRGPGTRSFPCRRRRRRRRRGGRRGEGGRRGGAERAREGEPTPQAAPSQREN